MGEGDHRKGQESFSLAIHSASCEKVTVWRSGVTYEGSLRESLLASPPPLRVGCEVACQTRQSSCFYLGHQSQVKSRATVFSVEKQSWPLL